MLKLVLVFHPILCVAVSRANDASSFLNHLENDATMDIAHDICVVWLHDSVVKRRTVTVDCGCDSRISPDSRVRTEVLYAVWILKLLEASL